MNTWLNIVRYPGFSILDDGSKLKTPQGEFNLTLGKPFSFINPNTKTKNIATPETLLRRASLKPKKPAFKKDEEKQKKHLEKTIKIQKKLKKSKAKKQLLPDEVVGELRYYFEQQIKLDNGEAAPSGQFYHGTHGLNLDFNRGDQVRCVLDNTKKGLILLRVVGPSDWREDWWFFNPNTEKYLKFEKAIHQPTPGNSGVIWPDGLDGEHLFGSDYTPPNIRLRRRKIDE